MCSGKFCWHRAFKSHKSICENSTSSTTVFPTPGCYKCTVFLFITNCDLMRFNLIYLVIKSIFVFKCFLFTFHFFNLNVQEVMLGGSLNLTCVAVGSPMPFVKWRLLDEDLTPENDVPIGKSTLALNDIRTSANYTCVASSSLGVIEANAMVKVQCELNFELFEFILIWIIYYQHNHTNKRMYIIFYHKIGFIVYFS